MPYIIKWLMISAIVGIAVGSASAGFLISLNWVTDFRENNLWLIALLTCWWISDWLIVSFLGKDIEAGNNLLIDSIHNPKEIIPLRWLLFIYRDYCYSLFWWLCW